MARLVSDAGPLIHLAQANKLYLLERLFSQVSITPDSKKEAYDQGVRLGHHDAEIIGEAIQEWITIEALPQTVLLASKKLAEGENISEADAGTLLLAVERRAEILVDEKVLSDLAKMHGLKVWNTWTTLLESLRRGLIQIADIESAITELGEKRHKLTDKQAAEILNAARQMTSPKHEREKEADTKAYGLESTWTKNLISS